MNKIVASLFSVPVLAAATIHPPSLQAQTAATTNHITLEGCVAMALTNNLDIQIEKINPDLARYDLEIARAGYDPVFAFGGLHSSAINGSAGIGTDGWPLPHTTADGNTFNSSVGGLGPMGMQYSLGGKVNENYGTTQNGNNFTSSGGSVGLSVTQPLLKNFIIDNTRYSIMVTRKQLKISELALKSQFIKVVSAVEQAYYDLIYARENIKVQEEGLNLAQRLFKENQTRVTIGALSKFDEKQSESQVSARQADLTAAFQTYSTAQNVLKRLLTARYVSLHDIRFEPVEALVAVPQKLDVQDSWRVGMAERPDLLQSRLNLERQGITVKYLKNQMLPELDITGSYGHGASGYGTQKFGDSFNDFGNGDKPYWTFGGSVTVPLSNKAARERYRQSKEVSTQMLLTLKKQEETAMVEIDEAVNRLRTYLDKIQSTRDARIYAEQALSAEQTKLNNGKSTSFVVLQLQKDLTSARSEEIRALTDYNKALSALYSFEGTTLQRRNLQVEMK